MEQYGKIFRRKNNKNFDLRSYNPNEEKYFEVIKTARKEGYFQLIMNSELMISLMYSTLEKNGLVLKISMSDNTDQDTKDNIQFILKKLRKDNLLFIKLKEELEWAVDSGSIDIQSVDILYRNERFTVLSNGIIIGVDIKSFFDNLIIPLLGKYFNG